MATKALKTLSLLLPRQQTGTDFYNREYTAREIRLAIRNLHDLPPMNDIRLDIEAVYPLLSREFRDVFDMYALGYKLDAIALYWQSLFSGRAKGRNYGTKIVGRVVDRVKFYLTSYVGQVDADTLEQRSQWRVVPAS